MAQERITQAEYNISLKRQRLEFEKEVGGICSTRKEGVLQKMAPEIRIGVLLDLFAEY